MPKRLFFLVVFVLAVTVAAHYLSLRPKVLPQVRITLPISIPTIIQVPITETDILSQLNSYRTENKMLALKENNKLDKAALARLSVITTKSDYDGTKTGVTLVNAAKDNDYLYSVISDFYAADFGSVAELIGRWQQDTTAQKTLNDKSFRDVGLALSHENGSIKAYLILARALSVVTQPVGSGGYPHVTWGGPELWAAVNKRRQELGVNPLNQKEELCTIASIRLNQLLELGKLDGHAGFEPTLNRPDLVWIKGKYNLSEFLVVGYPTPQDTVAAWEHTLGHKELLSGGQYVWGCVYSQDTFGVAIAAY